MREAENSLERIRNQINLNSGNESKLNRFGDTFFDTYQSSFQPINLPNMQSDYVLDVGDQLTIQLVGQSRRNKDIRSAIKRDGSILIPDVGKVFLAGLRLDQAFSLIENKISESLIGVEAFSSLTALRDINVLVVGNIVNPGIYTLAGGSNPLALINAAGGINENGSYRKIIHKRSGKIISEIDLYDVFISGDISVLGELRSGDSLVIEPSLNQVRISGGVSTAAIYEIKESERITDLFRFSGLKTNSNLSSIFSLKKV